MTPETLHPCAHRIALTYPFTEHCWPFGPEYDVFKVDGRIFMITMTIRGRALVNLKAEPQKSLLIKSPEHLLRAFLFDLFSIIANSAKILCINRSFSPPHHQP